LEQPQRHERLMYVASPLALLVLWEALARLGLIDVRFFPAPSEVLVTFVHLLLNGELPRQTWITLVRTVIGFAIGGAAGVLLGIAMGLARPVQVVVQPVVDALYPIPKIAIMPLFLLIFGIGDTSKVAIVAVGVFFLMLYNTLAGVLGIARIYLDVGQVFGARGWRLFATVALPGALPLIMTGVKVSVGMALVLIIAAEFVGSDSGLGYMIWNAWQIFSVNQMYVGLLTVSLIGYLSSLAIGEIERVVLPWRGRS
jgi:ABC-type nitrate/sulfonate/bicarbonate transport system permease component